MPPVVAVVSTVLINAGLAVGLGSAVWTLAPLLASALVYGSLSIVVGLLAKPKMPGAAEAPRPSDMQQTVRQATGPRRRHYGRVKVSGLLNVFQSDNGLLYSQILLGEGRIHAFREHWLNDKRVEIDVNNLVTDGQYILDGGPSRVMIAPQLGTDDQPAHSALTAAFPEQITSAHRCRGIANVLCRYKEVPADKFSKVYPNGPPGYRAVIDASLVYDPREDDHDADDEDSWEWSDNAALCILDYLTHADGMGRPRSMFSEASFAAAADICDEDIPLKDGGTEKRYRLSGTYMLTERPVDVLQRMLAVCDGELFQLSDGTWGLRVGKWEEPTVTIEDRHVLAYRMEQGSDALAAFNRLKLIYVSPDHDYQEQEAQPLEDEGNLALLGQEKNQDLSLVMCQSPSQARRLGKIAMAKGNPRWRGTVTTTFGGGLAALGERFIRVQLAELDIDEPFQLLAFSLAADLSSCELSISSLSEDAYAWDPDADEGEAPPIPVQPAPVTIDVPSNFAVVAVDGPKLSATWDLPERETESHELNWRVAGDDWIAVTIEAGTHSWLSPVVDAATTYELRLRARMPAGRTSDWTATVEVIIP